MLHHIGYEKVSSKHEIGTLVRVQRFGDRSNQGRYDDSGFNAIRLACSGGEVLISAEGVEGDWTPWKFTHGNTSIFEVWIRSQRFAGSGDDTATNGLRFKDSNHKTYEPYVGYWNKDDFCDSTTGGHWRYGLKHRLHGYWASATC